MKRKCKRINESKQRSQDHVEITVRHHPHYDPSAQVIVPELVKIAEVPEHDL